MMNDFQTNYELNKLDICMYTRFSIKTIENIARILSDSLST